MKKYTLIAVVMIMSLLNLAGVLSQPTSANGDYGCLSVAACKGGATCGSDGNPSGCVIGCLNGATLICPRRDDDENN